MGTQHDGNVKLPNLSIWYWIFFFYYYNGSIQRLVFIMAVPISEWWSLYWNGSLALTFLCFVGIGGSGRQSACKLATFMADYDIFQIEITRTYSVAEWREDIKKVRTTWDPCAIPHFSPFILGWVGLWGFLWWAPSAKRKDHHGVRMIEFTLPCMGDYLIFKTTVRGGLHTEVPLYIMMKQTDWPILFFSC